jgi:hypothetical protein
LDSEERGLHPHHYAHDSPLVFEDPLAGSFITPEEREIIENSWLARLGPEPAAAAKREAALAQCWRT